VINIKKIGKIVIEIKNKSFLSLRFIFSFGFFMINKKIIKRGKTIVVCFNKKITG